MLVTIKEQASVLAVVMRVEPGLMSFEYLADGRSELVAFLGEASGARGELVGDGLGFVQAEGGDSRKACCESAEHLIIDFFRTLD